jgi:hypothetical protein
MELTPLPKALQEYSRTSSRDISTLEAVRLHYAAGRKLTPAQEEYRVRMEAAHAFFLEHKTRSETVAMLQSLYGLKTTQAYKVCSDSDELFGDVGKHSREGTRYILIEQLRKKAASLLEDNDKTELYLRCLDMIAKLSGAYDHAPKGNPDKHKLPKAIIFSTDPLALELQREQETAEDIDYEES